MTPAEFRAFIDRNIKGSPAEATIVRRVFWALKDNGTPVVAVFDGEDRTPVRTLKECMDVVFNLDECHLLTAANSWVFIVMGNGWDALTDYTTDLEGALSEVNAYIDQKSAESY
jgi:hypothetical protein